MMERRVPGMTVPEVPLIIGVNLSPSFLSLEQHEKMPFLCIGQAPMKTFYQVIWIEIPLSEAKPPPSPSLVWFPIDPLTA